MNKNPTRNRISARDAEDMTKIILADAIEAERKRIAKLGLKTPLASYDMKTAIAKAVFKASKWSTNADLRFRTASGDVIAFYRGGMLEGEEAAKYNVEIDVEVTDSVMKKVVGMHLENEAIRERVKAEEQQVNLLSKRLNDYKDQAARFRLGFTGNPNHIDEVSASCKAYMLAKEAK